MVSKPSLFIVVSLLLVSLIAVPASANTTVLTFSDMGLEKNEKIILYCPTAEDPFIGEYNTTDTVTLTEDAYILAFKPSEQHWFQNPLNMLTLLQAEIPVWISAFMLLFTVFGGLFAFYAFFIRRR